MLVDSHCHLNFNELYSNIEYFLKMMQENDVRFALCIGTALDNLSTVVEVANKYRNIFATVGIHPDEQLDSSVEIQANLAGYLSNHKVVGLGETGLDYYRVESGNLDWQRSRFRLHIELAQKHKLPLVVHTRNSIEDTLGILSEYNLSDSGVVMHCFTENLDQARKCIERGYYISISGIVTFKNASVVQEMAKFVPNDRLLIETDSPFLAPVPFRGKGNHPALIKYTAQYLANLRSSTLDKIGEITTENFFSLFKKAKDYLERW